MDRFEGKVVLLSGAARGIGAVAAELMAREGAHVMVTDCSADDAQSSIDHLIDGGLRIEADCLDVTNETDWDRVISDLLARFGHLDVLVNNAGIAMPGTVEQCTMAEWRTTQAVNVEGVFLGTQKAIEVMKKDGGSIVNVASVAANIGEPALTAYNASKGAVRSFTKAAALHCTDVGYRIRVNSLHPGYTETQLVRGVIESMPEGEGAAYAEYVINKIPMKRLAMPAEIAKPLLFLASDDASYMTGSELVVDGGYIAA